MCPDKVFLWQSAMSGLLWLIYCLQYDVCIPAAARYQCLWGMRVYFKVQSSICLFYSVLLLLVWYMQGKLWNFRVGKLNVSQLNKIMQTGLLVKEDEWLKICPKYSGNNQWQRRSGYWTTNVKLLPLPSMHYIRSWSQTDLWLSWAGWLDTTTTHSHFLYRCIFTVSVCEQLSGTCQTQANPFTSSLDAKLSYMTVSAHMKMVHFDLQWKVELNNMLSEDWSKKHGWSVAVLA